MIEIKKTVLKNNCNCSKQQVILEVNFSFLKDHLNYFINNNYLEVKSYTDIGILYIEDNNLVAIGPFGSNRLQIKCKNSNCEAGIANLESVIMNIA